MLTCRHRLTLAIALTLSLWSTHHCAANGRLAPQFPSKDGPVLGYEPPKIVFATMRPGSSWFFSAVHDLNEEKSWCSNAVRGFALLLACGPFDGGWTSSFQANDKDATHPYFGRRRMNDGGAKLHFGGAIIEHPLRFGDEEAAEPNETQDASTDHAAELYQRAEILLHEGRIHRACELYEQIREIALKSRYALMAQDRLRDLEDLRRTPEQNNTDTDHSQSSSEEQSASLLFGEGFNAIVPRPICVSDRQVAILDLANSTVTISFVDVPFHEAIETIAPLYSMKIHYNKESLEKASVQLDAKVTFACEDVTLQSALERLCERVDLKCTVDRDTIIIKAKPKKSSKPDKLKIRICGSGRDVLNRVARNSIQDKLQKKISVDFERGTLKEFCTGLRTWHKFNVVCDEQAMQEIGFDPAKEKFGLRADDSIHNLLAFVLKLRDHRLDFYVEGDKIVVTTKYVTKGPVVLAAYDLTELMTTCDVRWDRKNDTIALVHQHNPKERVRDVVQLIVDGVEPSSWEQNGGIGRLEHHPATNALVVCAAPDVQEQVHDLLVALYREQQLTKERFEKMAKNVGQPFEPNPIFARPAGTTPRLCPALAKRRAEAMHLIEQSFAALQAGRMQHAKELAARAMKLDKQAVLGHPLTYKMQLFEQLGESKVIELASEPEPTGTVVVSEGKTFGPSPGGSEASGADWARPSLPPTGWCFDVDVDQSSGRWRARLQATFGPLTIRAHRNKDGHGQVKVSIGIGK